MYEYIFLFSKFDKYILAKINAKSDPIVTPFFYYNTQRQTKM